ncbi:penicillin-binding protein 1B [Rheinheimera riviphila]|uniref:Penicillin-binding protein 1B n=1 Tax=Rheinheimera riviphila TaxID=1834037 RepID=A0A437R4N9_9GAMM|nr:penicillin-binding protein 1B [Rheinheimera riviphila]RVU41739.1 penicillin-binding protein 1B [Rheinheimera riviphila]
MTPRKPRTKKANTLKPLYHSIGWFCLKAALVLTLTLFIYLIYLDSKITSLFSGQKWQIPAQLYGRSLALAPGKHLSQVQMLDELQRLQYREDPRLSGPGQYHVSGQTVSVFRRAFDFPAGHQVATLLHVGFAGEFVQSLSTGRERQALTNAQLEPQLLQHLVAAEQEDRELLVLDQVPKTIKDTLLLVEDRDFYSHHGVSAWSVLRAFWANLQAGKTVQGGSTLTQQLAKNMYTNQQRTYFRKVNEALIALVLDYRYSKDQILEAYLNEISLGQFKANPVHGLGLGSKLYFGKPLAELRPHEYALLIAIIKGPSHYDPRRYPKRAEDRRDLILGMMRDHGLLDQTQWFAATSQPLDVIPIGEHLKGRFPAYIDKVRQELRELVKDKTQLQNGIRVFTYFDAMAQQAAEQAVLKRVAKLDPAIEAAVVATDYQQGALTAIIGGRNTTFAGYNRAISAQRQIGSIIKPVVYLTALQQPQRFHLGTILADTPLTLKSGSRNWSPLNYDKKFRGNVSLMSALSDSLNIPTVRLGLQLGLPALQQELQQLGLEREVKLQPSSLLGAVEMSPLEVAQLYQTIANKGQYRELATIAAITTHDGAAVYQRQSKPQQRVDASAAYLLQFALQQATQSGTAQSLAAQFPRQKFAGKTGTSSDYRDSWFTGFDHETSLTVWLGRDDNKAIGLTGGSGALPIFSTYFQQLGVNSLFRAVPENVQKQFISKTNGRFVEESCVNVLLLPVIWVEMPLQQHCD